jgi:hypothetical protein
MSTESFYHFETTDEKTMDIVQDSLTRWEYEFTRISPLVLKASQKRGQITPLAFIPFAQMDVFAVECIDDQANRFIDCLQMKPIKSGHFKTIQSSYNAALQMVEAASFEPKSEQDKELAIQMVGDEASQNEAIQTLRERAKSSV